MGKKQKKKVPRHKKFADHVFSSIEEHDRKGKHLSSPLKRLPGSSTSWRDDYLPNVVWAALLTDALPRADCLELFRGVLMAAKNTPAAKDIHLVHNHLSTLSYEAFESIFRPLRSSDVAMTQLSCLRLLESLPDRAHWVQFTSDRVPSDAWTRLSSAIAINTNHQSQTATDIRWVKLMHMIASGKITFPPNLEERLREIVEYPARGDMKSVRPSIRSMEMMIRAQERGEYRPEQVPDIAADEFWAECLKNTQCLLIPIFPTPDRNNAELMTELEILGAGIGGHFDAVSLNTGIDARKDSAFALPLYAVALTMEAASSRTHRLSGGRMILRTLTECLITLRYLRAKDDPAIWQQYRNYGAGQAKLAFLKLIREDELPKYVDIDDLHDLTNEDAWLELQDVNLGAWEGSNLREMAEFANCKDVYDRYYAWTSGFTHGQWATVRDAVFTTCLNSLHRFHRVPMSIRAMPSILPDACKLINQMLDDLSALYPSFKPRIKWHNSEVAQEAPKNDG